MYWAAFLELVIWWWQVKTTLPSQADIPAGSPRQWAQLRRITQQLDGTSGHGLQFCISPREGGTEQRSEGGKGGSHPDTYGKSIQSEGTASAKALEQECVWWIGGELRGMEAEWQQGKIDLGGLSEVVHLWDQPGLLAVYVLRISVSLGQVVTTESSWP